MRPLRMLLPGTIYFITNRCVDEQFFLKPGKKINNLIGGWLGRALAKYGRGITIYGFIFMSNHYHILLKDTKGMMPKFMWYFQTNLAKAINREMKRHGGSVFAKRYDAVPVADDESFLNRLIYILGNGVKARLVKRADQWPGLSSLGASLNGEKLIFKMLNATAYQLACLAKGANRVNKKDYIETYIIPIAPPDCFADKSPKKVQSAIRDLLTAFEQKHALERKDKGQKVLGVKKIMSTNFRDRPVNPSFSPRVMIFCKDKFTKEEYKEALRSFTAAYQEASASFKNATMKKKRSMAEWPDYSCPPFCIIPTGYKEAV